ncbi:Uncharacterised protein [Vibrio cholerae]|nr:Uncharacterised protein [Vibrio cholerae]CSI34999.1 Uncharacterised protein [Vibrio cholerae]
MIHDVLSIAMQWLRTFQIQDALALRCRCLIKTISHFRVQHKTLSRHQTALVSLIRPATVYQDKGTRMVRR